MQKYRMGVSAVLLGLFLFGAPADAEQVYVRNKPYKGVVSSVGGQVWVDLKGLAQALDMTVQPSEAGGLAVSRSPLTSEQLAQVGAMQVVIEGKPVEAQANSEGVILVPLKTAAELLGARVVANKQLGSIDVSLLPARTGATPTSGGSQTVAAVPAPAGPIVRTINTPGAAVDISRNLVAGRINVVEFTAPW